MKDSEADNRENSEIIAEISAHRLRIRNATDRLTQRYQRIHLRLQYRCPITKPLQIQPFTITIGDLKNPVSVASL